MTQTDFCKTVRIGESKDYAGRSYSVFCRIQFCNGKLSITGVEGPTRGGNSVGACGQIVMSEWNISSYAPGWNKQTEDRFRKVWDEWHLNDMQAGTPEQTEALKDFYATRKYPENDYTHACEYLKNLGLYEVPDPRFPDPSPITGERAMYKYGHAWLRVEVPAEVLDFLRSLPDTDKTPAWI